MKRRRTVKIVLEMNFKIFQTLCVHPGASFIGFDSLVSLKDKLF